MSRGSGWVACGGGVGALSRDVLGFLLKPALSPEVPLHEAVVQAPWTAHMLKAVASVPLL